MLGLLTLGLCPQAVRQLKFTLPGGRHPGEGLPGGRGILTWGKVTIIPFPPKELPMTAAVLIGDGGGHLITAAPIKCPGTIKLDC